ncbi:MAG: Gfo/Idh/MocA family protein [Thermoanaerobaculia bacterium]
MSVRTVGLIGLGGVARRIHLPAIAGLAGLRLVGAAEVDPENERLAAARNRVPRVYRRVEELLAAERPEIVIVGTPPSLHFEHVRASLEAGAHVLCEKPFVTTIDEADALIDLAEKSGRLLAVNNQYRFMTIYRETERRLRSGEFGEPYQIQVWQQMYHPPSFEKNWRAGLLRSTLYEFGTHALDLVCFLFGSIPEAVSANIPRVPQGVESDVLVVLTLRFAGGKVATLNLHRLSHAPERYLEMRLDATEASIRLSLGGVARFSLDWVRSLGRPQMKASYVRGGEARVERRGRSRVLSRSPRPEFASATASHLADFLRRLDEGRTGAEAARHAREILRVVFAAYLSAESGKTVEIPPAS